jgi:uncharacterized repeat protein (TIGR03803 family)
MRSRVLPALIAGLGLMLAGQATAQTFTTLHSFSVDTLALGSLVSSGNTLYGTSQYGGSGGVGTVFSLNTNGTGFTTLYSFSAFTPVSGVGLNSDGGLPFAGLLLSGNTVYGTAPRGGDYGYGTVFSLNTNGTAFTTLYDFADGSDGAAPYAGLILSGNTLYGTAERGGDYGYGTVFSLNTDGTGFTTLYSFTATTGTLGLDRKGTNSDGAYPEAGLVLSGNTLFGTAAWGGSSGFGTVFSLNTNGTGFTTLHSFADGSDGAVPAPYAGLVLSGKTLYGTAEEGGDYGYGTVFSLNTNGAGFTTLYSFTGGDAGEAPNDRLVLSGGMLYGTADGGSASNGTVFAINTNGTGFTNLYGFPNGIDGALGTGLILCGNALYGTTSVGGAWGDGTVFSLTLPPVSAPQLTLTRSGANVILSWPATAAGFTLQSTTNLGLPAFWTTNSPAPVLVNGQNVVTNALSGIQQFYRLTQ